MMQKYRVILNGENFLLHLSEGTPKKYGFYTTRWVKAIDQKEAEIKAVNLVRQSSELKEATLNKKEDPPTIYLESITTIGFWEFLMRNPGRGFTFFPDEVQENETAC